MKKAKNRYVQNIYLKLKSQVKIRRVWIIESLTHATMTKLQINRDG